jgi:hypothetical protein
LNPNNSIVELIIRCGGVALTMIKQMAAIAAAQHGAASCDLRVLQVT